MWAIIVTAAQWIWNGVQAVAVLTIHALSVIVGLLWSGLKAVGGVLASVGRGTWRFFRNAWDHVIRPAWTKFFKFVDRVHDWLDRHLGPLLRKVNAIRSKLQGFWKRYIRPILDIIDIGRSVLRILSQLGADWAKRLDAELARIQAAIEKPFLELLRRLNEVANWINRIVTLDGLFQRVILLGSLFEHAGETWNQLVGAGSSPIGEFDRVGLWDLEPPDVRAEVVPSISQYLETGGGPDAEEIRTAAAAWREYLNTA